MDDLCTRPTVQGKVDHNDIIFRTTMCLDCQQQYSTVFFLSQLSVEK